MVPLSLILYTAAFPFPPSEAELLLREVEAKIAAAKTLRIEYTLTFRNGSVEEQHGALLLAPGNRARVEMRGTDIRGVTHLGFPALSNGKELVEGFAAESPHVAGRRSRVPEWYNEVLQSWLGRGGTFPSSSAISLRSFIGKKPGSEAGPRTSNVRLLPDQDVNSVKARVVEYELDWPAGLAEAGKAKMQVWIDAKTKLPLRRTMVVPAKPHGTARFTETKFKINPKLDDKLFELPK